MVTVLPRTFEDVAAQVRSFEWFKRHQPAVLVAVLKTIEQRGNGSST